MTSSMNSRRVRLVIAGPRGYEDYDHLEAIMLHNMPWEVIQIVQGDCPTGVDAMARRFAVEYGIDLRCFPPDWDTHGRRAGPLRNAKMAQYGHALLAIWDGKSRGTRSMIAQAHKYRKDTLIVYTRSPR